MINSQSIEKNVLSCILQHQHKWEEVASFLNDEDFYSKDSKVNVSIFKIVKRSLDNAEKIDEHIVIERLNALGVSFPDSIDIGEYIRSMAFMLYLRRFATPKCKRTQKIYSKKAYI